MKTLNFSDFAIKLYIYLFFALLILSGCADRDRTNPFDSKGKFKAPATLEIEQRNNFVYLSWTVNNIVDYTGFRIYRAVDDSSQFNLFKELSAESNTTFDTDIENGHWYYYYLTVVGPGIESSPSTIEQILPGPGDIWILSRFGYAVRTLSYDLLRIENTFNLNYPPMNWDFPVADKYIWLAYPDYRTVSRLNLSQGYEDLIFQKDLQDPIDVQSAELLSQVYILDREAKAVFFFNQETITDTLPLIGADPIRILFTPDLTLWVLDSSGVKGFNQEGASLDTLSFQAGETGRDMILWNGKLHVLAANRIAGSSSVYSFTEPDGNITITEYSGVFEILRKSVLNDDHWVVEKTAENNSRIVQLSTDGQRLLELPAMNQISDFQINPQDGSLVIVQRYEDKISLYDKDGNFKSMNDRIYDPIKVLIK